MEVRSISARSSNLPGWEGSKPLRIVTRSRGLPTLTTISKRGKYEVERSAFRKGQRRSKQDLLKSCPEDSSVARMGGTPIMSLAAAIKVTTVPNEPAILSDIRKFFVAYGPTFVELADRERSDLDALLGFYGATLRFIGLLFHMVMN